MKIQVEALFTSDRNGHLRGINDPDGEIRPAPRFFFGHTKEGSICRFRYDLPESVVTPLKEVAAAEPLLMDSQKFPRGHSQFKDILQSHAPIERVWVGPAYRFTNRIDLPANVVRLSCDNAGLLRGNFAKMVPELDSGRPYWAVSEDSHEVSICQSVRSMQQAVLRWSRTVSVGTQYQLTRRGHLQSVHLTSSRFTALRGKMWLPREWLDA